MEELKNTNNFQEELSLLDIIKALWRQKLPIISITLIAAILTVIISVFVLSPVYHARLNIVINMPETYSTKYGDYSLPITTNEQYINLITSNDVLSNTIEDMGYEAATTTIEAIRERITVDIPAVKTTAEQNSFHVKVAADNPEEARILAQTLFDNYVEFLDVITVEGALAFYTNKYNVALASLDVSLRTNKEILVKNEALLATTPQTINQREAMQEIQDVSNTSDYVILENVINPNYTKIEQDIIANKQAINSIENSMRVYNENLTELDAMKDRIVSYRETGNYGELKSQIVSVTKTNIYLPSDPVAPSNKTSPSNAKNVIIGTLLGGIIGVLVALIKEYWFKTNK